MQASTALKSNGKRRKILVVDDYPPTRNLLVEALSQAGDYELSEAADGTEALDLFKTVSYDMVISDIMMPVMGGMDLLHAIKELSPLTAVIMITAHPALELIVTAMKQGAVDFIKKPFNIDELLFKVNLYLPDAVADTKDDGESGNNFLNFKKDQLALQSYIYDSVEATEGDHEEVFQKVVDLAMRIVEGESCVLALYDERSQEFYPKVIKNNNGSGRNDAVPFETKLFRKIVASKDALLIHSDDNPRIAPSLICVPLMIRENVLGVLSIRKKRHSGIFNKNDLHHILSLAKRASLNLENKVLYESIYANLMDTFKSLVAAIQVRDHYTEEHSCRVSALAVKIAQGLGCSPSEIESLRIAGLLHDIGKISIPDNILLKAGSLSAEEFEIIRNHPRIGEEILSSVVLLDKEREIVRHHHERWDGKGYPFGVEGENIPFLARILSVADSFDAMTSDRPYRNGMSVDNAAAELRKNKNIQFDKKIVDIFLNIL